MKYTVKNIQPLVDSLSDAEFVTLIRNIRSKLEYIDVDGKYAFWTKVGDDWYDWDVMRLEFISNRFFKIWVQEAFKDAPNVFNV
jgi:hypothetical protein